MAALSYDFSRIIECLGQSIADIQQSKKNLYREEPRLVCKPEASLRDCLRLMEELTSRFLLVQFPEGVPSQRPMQRLPTFVRRQESIGAGILPSHPGLAATTVTEDGHRFSIVVEPPSAADGDDKHVQRDQELEALSTAAQQSYLILDGRDIVHLLLARYREVYGEEGNQSDIPAIEFADTLLNSQAGDVANLCQRNDFKAIDDSASLSDLLKCFEHCTRVPIFRPYKRHEQHKPPQLVGVFSAEHFFTFLDRESRCADSGAFPPEISPSMEAVVAALNTKLSSLDHWTAGGVKRATQPLLSKKFTDVHGCLETQPVLAVLKILDKMGFNAVPLFSSTDPRKCSGMFSVRDVQPLLLRAADMRIGGPVLNMTAKDYISQIRQMMDINAKAPIMQVRESVAIDTVIGKLVAANVGRLLITDDDGNMTDLLSVTDVARFIARELARTK